MLPSPNLDVKFQNPARGLAALATGLAEAVNTLYAMPVNSGGGGSNGNMVQSKAASKARRAKARAGKSRSRDFTKAQHPARSTLRKVGGKPSSFTVPFSGVLQATLQLFATTQAKRGQNFDTTADYKYSTQTTLALQNVPEGGIQLVYTEKAHTRAAIIIQEDLWNTQQTVMVWTELPDDCPEDGMTIDYFSCRRTINSKNSSTWCMTPSEEPISHLSHQASSVFLSYLNEIIK